MKARYTKTSDYVQLKDGILSTEKELLKLYECYEFRALFEQNNKGVMTQAILWTRNYQWDGQCCNNPALALNEMVYFSFGKRKRHCYLLL